MPKQDKDKLCFVIAPIGDEGSDARSRSDKVLKHIITPAAQACGYKTIRADEISKPGIITTQVIQHLIEDSLVIADLTGHNPNVFYELAIRHAVKKPVVQMIAIGEPIPFDIAQSRTIRVDHRDLDSVAQCKEELIKQIRNAEANPTDIDTPISMAIDIQHLRQSENPLEKSNAEIMSLLQDIRARLETLSRTSSFSLFPHAVSAPRIGATEGVLSTEVDPKSGESRIVFRSSENIEPRRVFTRPESEASEKVQPRRVFAAPAFSPSEKKKDTK